MYINYSQIHITGVTRYNFGFHWDPKNVLNYFALNTYFWLDKLVVSLNRSQSKIPPFTETKIANYCQRNTCNTRILNEVNQALFRAIYLVFRTEI